MCIIRIGEGPEKHVFRGTYLRIILIYHWHLQNNNELNELNVHNFRCFFVTKLSLNVEVLPFLVLVMKKND